MDNSFYFNRGIVIVLDAEVREYEQRMMAKVWSHKGSLSPIEINVLCDNIKADFAVALLKNGINPYNGVFV